MYDYAQVILFFLLFGSLTVYFGWRKFRAARDTVADETVTLPDVGAIHRGTVKEHIYGAGDGVR